MAAEGERRAPVDGVAVPLVCQSEHTVSPEPAVPAMEPRSCAVARKACRMCRVRRTRCVGMVLPLGYEESNCTIVKAATPCQFCASKGLACLCVLTRSEARCRRLHEQALPMMSTLSYVTEGMRCAAMTASVAS